MSDRDLGAWIQCGNKMVGEIDIQLLSERHVPPWKCLRKPHIFTEQKEGINEYIYQKSLVGTWGKKSR